MTIKIEKVDNGYIVTRTGITNTVFVYKHINEVFEAISLTFNEYPTDNEE